MPSRSQPQPSTVISCYSEKMAVTAVARVALLFASLTCLCLPYTIQAEGGQPKSIFSRLSRTLQNAASTVTGATAAVEAVADDEEADTLLLHQPSVDVFKDVDLFKTADRLLKNDGYGVLDDLFAKSELKQIWGNPETAKFILDENPILKGFKPLQPLYAKEVLEPEDGLKVLDTLRTFVGKLPENAKALADPQGFADRFAHYATLDDPVLQDLRAKSDGGDFKASRDYLKHITGLEWDNLIDLDHFGLTGLEPESTSKLRAKMQDLDPDIYELVHQNDPYIKQFIDDPTFAAKAAAKVAGLSFPFTD